MPRPSLLLIRVVTKTRKPIQRRKPIARSSVKRGGGGIKRTSWLKRSGRPNPVNRKRKASSFARCYGSKERVAFVKRLPCMWCGDAAPDRLRDNAHSVKGRGQKAGYETIVPLCREDHGAYDEFRGPFAHEENRARVIADAPRVQGLWQAHLQEQGESA